MTKHLAIFSNNLAESVLFGRKTVDLRFSKSKIAPYLKVQKGDIILVKNVSQPVIGQVEVDNVLFYDDLTSVRLTEIRDQFLDAANIGVQEFIEFSQNARYLSLIFFKSPRRFLGSLRVDKKDRRGWAVL